VSTYRLQYLVKSGEPFSTVVTDGALAETVPGEDSAGADLVVSLSKAEIADLAAGTLVVDEGFMMGRIKIEGSMRTVMDLVPLLHDPAYGKAVATAASG